MYMQSLGYVRGFIAQILRFIHPLSVGLTCALAITSNSHIEFNQLTKPMSNRVGMAARYPL